jgi:hypothetical protein
MEAHGRQPCERPSLKPIAAEPMQHASDAVISCGGVRTAGGDALGWLNGGEAAACSRGSSGLHGARARSRCLVWLRWPAVALRSGTSWPEAGWRAECTRPGGTGREHRVWAHPLAGQARRALLDVHLCCRRAGSGRRGLAELSKIFLSNTKGKQHMPPTRHRRLLASTTAQSQTRRAWCSF